MFDNIKIRLHVGLVVDGLAKGIHGLGGGEGVVTEKKIVLKRHEHLGLKKFLKSKIKQLIHLLGSK